MEKTDDWRWGHIDTVTPNANVCGQASLISKVTLSCCFLGPRVSPTPHPGAPCQHHLQFGCNLGFDNSKTIYWHTQYVVLWEAGNSTLLYQSNFFLRVEESGLPLFTVVGAVWAVLPLDLNGAPSEPFSQLCEPGPAEPHLSAFVPH